MEELTRLKKDYEKALEEGVGVLRFLFIVEYFALERYFGPSHDGFHHSATAQSNISFHSVICSKPELSPR